MSGDLGGTVVPVDEATEVRLAAKKLLAELSKLAEAYVFEVQHGAVPDAMEALEAALGVPVVARDEANDWPEFRKLLTAKLVEAFDERKHPLNAEVVRQAIEANEEFREELKRLGLTVEDDEANDRDDLTTAYLAGFEKGRDAARDEANELRAGITRFIAAIDARDHFIEREEELPHDEWDIAFRRTGDDITNALAALRRLAGGESEEEQP